MRNKPYGIVPVCRELITIIIIIIIILFFKEELTNATYYRHVI